MKKKITVIVNPISGTKDKSVVKRLIEEKLDKNKYDVCLVETQYAGHAEKIAAEERDKGTDMVIAVGGDGTVNEVGRALVNSQTAMGIIPCGSGNGLARHLRIPMNVEKAIDIINKGDDLLIDYGKINNLPFFCTCGVGFDAHISMEFAKRGTRGLLTYIKTTVSEFFKYKPKDYILKIGENSEIHCRSFLITVANASQYGNNAFIAPKALITDGLLDVIILSPFPIYLVPGLAVRLFTKAMEGSAHITKFSCEHISIHREESGSVHFDGEPYDMGKDIDIEICKRGLKVLIPHFLKEKEQ
jgi:diacylglycerol kinase (ATP)